MSDTATTEATPTASVPVAPVIPPTPLGDITREGITVTFNKSGYQRGKLKAAGVTFPYPSAFDEKDYPLQNIITFLKEDMVRDILTAKLSQLFQSYGWEASDIDPKTDMPVGSVDTPHDWDKFVKFVTTMSARGESIRAKMARLVIVVNSFTTLKGEELLKAYAEAGALGAEIEAQQAAAS